ncbi:hypothetical protein C2869_12275 [Saccharobesus litoralis]|uniref:Tandem-95 repeat protein n=1 Tax=Saccharobesus litoralis TaxID=2172099 RepID=A0A2S0VSH4_9ALTE|nr:Ig-like domain-containing protein [Saccharobesus litoralis]AWB67164.1 hypothetical protein C2869_12275 [Saccharobesus litoralis]
MNRYLVTSQIKLAKALGLPKLLAGLSLILTFGLAATPPTVSDVSGLNAGVYNSQDTLDIAVSFSSDISHLVLPDNGVPMLVLALDSGNAYAQYVNHDGRTINFRYTPSFTNFDSNGISIIGFDGLLFSNNDELPVKPILSEPLQFNDVVIQHSNVAELPAPQVYLPGDTLDFKLRWGGVTSISVQSGTPQLVVDIAGSEKTLNGLANNSGELVFTYPVTSQDANLAELVVKQLHVNDAVIIGTLNSTLDHKGGSYVLPITNANFTYSGLYAANRPIQVGVSDAPEIIRINTEQKENLQAGDKVQFTARFSGYVNVTNSPSLQIEINGQIVNASYVSGTGTTDLVFEYELQSALNTTQDIKYLALLENDGSLTNTSGTSINLSLDNLNTTTGNIQLVTLASNAPDLINSSFSIDISLAVADDNFSTDQLIITNGEISQLNGDGTQYSAMVTPLTDGQVVISAVNVSSASSDSNQFEITRQYDGTAPKFATSQPAQNEQTFSALDSLITLQFDEAVKLNNELADALVVSDNQQQVLALANIEVNNQQIQATLADKLIPSGQYKITFNEQAITDLAGNLVSQLPDNISFTTENIAPVSANDQFQLLEDQALLLNVLANDSDAEDYLDQQQVTIVGSPNQGVVQVDSKTGHVWYAPSSQFSGNDSFSYTVSDQQGKVSNIATVDLQVDAVNDPPRLNMVTRIDIIAGSTINQPITVIDPEQDAISMSLASEFAWLTIKDNALTGQVPATAVGEITVPISLFDGNATIVESVVLNVTSPDPLAEFISINWLENIGFVNQPIALTIQSINTNYPIKTLTLTFDGEFDFISSGKNCLNTAANQVSCAITSGQEIDSGVTLLPTKTGQIQVAISANHHGDGSTVSDSSPIYKSVSITEKLIETATTQFNTSVNLSHILNIDVLPNSPGLETILASSAGENIKIVSLEQQSLLATINDTGDTVQTATIDVNQDALLDILVVNKQFALSALYLNNGDGTFAFHSHLPNAIQAKVIDTNQDDLLDIVLLNQDGIKVYAQQQQSYVDVWQLNQDMQIHYFDIADVNGDQVVDLVVATPTQVEVLLDLPSQIIQNQVKTASSALTFTLNANAELVNLVDLDNNGTHEILVANKYPHLAPSEHALDIYQYVSDSNQFERAVSIGKDKLAGVFAEQIDNQYGLDITALTVSGTVQTFVADEAIANNGQFSFTQTPELLQQSSKIYALADTNADAMADLVSYDVVNNQLDLYTTQGQGLFSQPLSQIDIALSSSQNNLVLPNTGAAQQLVLTALNNGDSPAMNAKLVFSLPQGVDISNNINCQKTTTGNASCTLGKIAVGQSASVNLTLSNMLVSETVLTSSIFANGQDTAPQNNQLSTTLTLNHAPIAANDTFSFVAKNNVSLDVLSNDTDQDSDALKISTASSDIGTVTVSSNNQINLSLAPDYLGKIIVNYTIEDPHGLTANAQATVDISAKPSKSSSGGSLSLWVLLLMMFRFIILLPNQNHARK